MIVYLDANIVIYLVENDPLWGPKAQMRITTARAAGDAIATSDASRLECLVGPFIRADSAILADYAAFFADPVIQVLPLTAAVCERAARIRATGSYKALDALHLAAAVEEGCGLFLTNDVNLRGFPDISVEILS